MISNLNVATIVVLSELLKKFSHFDQKVISRIIVKIRSMAYLLPIKRAIGNTQEYVSAKLEAK